MESHKNFDRVHSLYSGRQDKPYAAGFSAGSSYTIPQSPYQSYTPASSSPALSIVSIVSSSGRASQQSRESRASSTSTAPPWHDFPQQPAMTPVDYGYDLPCEFTFIGCDIRFHPEDYQEWINHSLSHFVDRPPPDYVICTFCDEDFASFQSQGSPTSNWYNRMMHIGGHFSNLETEARLRPDFNVIECMKRYRLISDEDYASARKYTERPRGCDGIVEHGHKTEEMFRRQEKDSRIVYDDRRERRETRHKGREHRSSHRIPRPVRINEEQ